MRSYTVLFVLFLTLFNSTYAAEKKPDSFHKGVEYFQKQQFTEALQQFELARKQGNHTPSLFYNLGSTYFKLDQFSEAEQAFTIAARDERFKQLSTYNLGLIALKRNNEKQALKFFYEASQPGGSKNVNALANRMIDRIHGQSADTTSVTLLLSTGTDSNVLLSTTGSPTAVSDTYNELYARVNYPLTSNLNLVAQYLLLDYSTVNAGDYDQLGAGFNYKFSYNGWKYIPELVIFSSHLNGLSYQSLTDLRMTATKRLDDKRSFLFRIRHTDIKADTPVYGYLEGSREQLRADYTQDTSLGQLRMRYELELNDRLDTATTSYSPTRHTLRVRLKNELGDSWNISAEAGWRDSSYDSVAGYSRNDTRFRIRGALEQKINRNLNWGMKVNYLDNDSDIAAEVYTRTDTQLYLRAVY